MQCWDFCIQWSHALAGPDVLVVTAINVLPNLHAAEYMMCAPSGRWLYLQVCKHLHGLLLALAPPQHGSRQVGG